MKRGCLTGCGGALGVFLVLAVLWWGHVTAPATVQVPPQTLPARNARDGYLAAVNAMVDSPLVAKPEDGTPAKRAAALKPNAQALFLLRQALMLPYCEPRPANPTAPTPEYTQYRQLARLLRLEATVNADRGEWGSAAQSGLDGVQFGSSLSGGAPLLGMLVGIACESIGRADVGDALPHLDAGEAKAAAARLQAILDTEVSFADVITEEKHRGQIMAADALLVGAPGWALAGAGHALQQGKWAQVPRALLTGRRQALANLAATMDHFAANSRQPYAARPPSPPTPSDPLSQMLIPSCDRSWFTHVRNRANNTLFLVEFALCAYRMEQGRYPDRLDQLVPGYLVRVPEDPFALKGPLQYRRQGDGYLLYSIGPDGKDDGGKSIQAAHPAGGFHIVEADSKGDMVAGVNR